MTDLSEFTQSAEVEKLRQALQNTSRQLREAKSKNAAIVEAIYQGAYDAALTVGGTKPIPPKKDKRPAKDEVALWHCTDWQGGKKTTDYNSVVMRTRVERFVNRAKAITEVQRSDHPVRKCVILFGGDMVEGLFNFPTQPYEVDSTIFEQYVTVSGLIVDLVKSALEMYEEVVVFPEWGNHGRMGSKRDAIPKSDNIDRMVYELARQNLKGQDRLEWSDCEEDIQRVEIGNYRALLMHGDEVGRAGFASPSAWQAAGNRWKAGAYKVDGKRWDFRDIYLGHYHLHAQNTLADGEGAVYWTGSTESGNRYARDSMAAGGEPSQRLHFIDPDRGRVTAQYQIYLNG